MYIYIVCVCVHSLVVHLCCFCACLTGAGLDRKSKLHKTDNMRLCNHLSLLSSYCTAKEIPKISFCKGQCEPGKIPMTEEMVMKSSNENKFLKLRKVETKYSD